MGRAKSSLRTLIINGNGATMDGKGSKSFLTVLSEYSVTINNLNIANNYRYRGGGGAVFVNEGGELHVNNCSFTNCRAPNKDENVHGGAIRGGYGARIYVNNSIFEKNYATFGGGAIVIGATISNLTMNSKPTYLDVTNLTPTLIISNSRFIGNAAGHGGAINVEEYCASIISNCTFKGNSAIDSDTGLGGGICTDMISCLVSLNNTFQDNAAKKSGGGIYNGPDCALKIDNNVFVKNQASYGGGICNLDKSALTIIDSVFVENNACDAGGAIHNANYCNISINNSIFTNNTATNGGAICNLYDNKITVSDCTFNSNAASNFGGAFHNGENGDVVMKNTNLMHNVADVNGGAISIGKNTGITAVDTMFYSNKAVVGGAVCGSIGSRIVADNITFNENEADIGGAVYSAKGSIIIINNSQLTSNKVTTNGGAIYIRENVALTSINTAFSKNMAEGLGGAICGGVKSEVILANCEFKDNDASSGNAVYNPKQAVVILMGNTSIDSADFQNNGELKIEDAINTKISIDSIAYSSKLVISGRLVDEYDFPIFDETVTVNLENNTITVKTEYGGKFIAVFANIIPGKYDITVTYDSENSIYNPSTSKMVGMHTTRIVAADMTTTYNGNANMVIGLKNSQDEPLTNVQISVDLGTGAKYYRTDNKGQVKLATNNLVPKHYAVKIVYSGDENHMGSFSALKITVKKATPKIIASKKTFKAKTKSKKYDIILKSDRNLALKNKMVYLKVKGKTYSAKTNSNGKASFKITNLTKKGTFKATITFKGDTCYNKKMLTKMIAVK